MKSLWDWLLVWKGRESESTDLVFVGRAISTRVSKVLRDRALTLFLFALCHPFNQQYDVKLKKQS